VLRRPVESALNAALEVIDVVDVHAVDRLVIERVHRPHTALPRVERQVIRHADAVSLIARLIGGGSQRPS
jgi:hypothetical protein